MKYLVSLFLSLLPAFLFAQEVEMADTLYASGKIYVVVGVLVIIVAGLFGFMIYLDRKITRLEKGKKA